MHAIIICKNNTVFAKSDFWSKTRQPAPVSPTFSRTSDTGFGRISMILQHLFVENRSMLAQNGLFGVYMAYLRPTYVMYTFLYFHFTFLYE